MRKVSVGLEADVAGFVRPVEAAKKAVDDLGDKVDSLDRSLGKIPADAAKAGAAMKLLGGDVNSVGDKVSSLGTKNIGLAVLDARIRESQKEVRKLADEFQRTGDIDVFRKLGDSEGHLRNLKDTRKKLADALVITPDEAKGVFKHFAGIASQVGSETGKIFSGGLTGALSTPVLGPILVAALGTVLVSAVGMVLANAGGLILAAGALGGVGLGIAGAIMGDPKAIGGAWSAEIGKLKEKWLASSTVFRGPLIDAAHEFGAVVSNIHLDVIMAKAAGYMPALTTGAAGLAKNLGGAFESLVDGAGPVMKVLSAELPKIGLAIKQASAAIAAGGEGGAQALQDLLQVTESLIVGIGRIIGVAEKAYGALAKFRDFVVPDSLRWLFGLQPADSIGLQTGARALGDVTTAAEGSAVASRAAAAGAKALGNALDEMRSKAFAAADADLALKQGWLDLKKELDDGAKTLNTNTQAGIDNVRGIKDQIENAERLRQQQIKLGGDTVEAHAAADAAYDESIERIRRMAYAAHFNKEQVDALIASITAIPPAKSAEIKTPGLDTALAQGISLGNALNNLHDKTVHVTVAVSAPAGISLGNLTHHATGGVVQATGASVVGEEGPEIAWLNQGQYISTAQQTRELRAMGQMGNGNSYGFNVSAGGGGMPRELVLNATFIDPMDGGMIRKQVIRWSLDRGRDPAAAFA